MRVECEFRIQAVSRYDFDPEEFRDRTVSEIANEIAEQIPWVADSEDLYAAALKVYCAAAGL